MDYFQIVLVTLEATIRLSVPLIFAALAGLYSERSGVFDIGLEGKMLAAAFAGGPLEPRVIDTGIGSASAMKMCFAAWNKGRIALAAEVLADAIVRAVRTARGLPSLPGVQDLESATR